MEKNKISEKAFLVNNDIYGEVSIKDSDGNVLLDKKNMIVLSGRRAIMNVLFSNTSAYLFNTMYMGSGTDLSNQNMTASDAKVSISFGIPSVYYTGVTLSSSSSSSYTYTFGTYNNSSSKTSTSQTVSSASVSAGDEISLVTTTAESVSGGQFAYMVDSSSAVPECHICCKYKETSSQHAITEMGLMSMSAGSYPVASSDTLFSRVVFDPVYLMPGSSYQIDYHIYF
jgi:hypothetical protein